MQNDWTPSSWKRFPARQQVHYDDPAELESTLAKLARLPPIVTSWEVEKLKTQLAEAGRGERFLLQGGDCNERFVDCQSNRIDKKLKVLLQMSAVLIYGSGRRVVRVGRIAGQYAKPRSEPTETRDGVTLPAYRGDLVNRTEFTAAARRPDPSNLLEAYGRSAMTINFVRSLLSGGFGDVHHPEVWDLQWVEKASEPDEYRALVESMRASVRFLDAMVGRPVSELANVDFYTSHEGLHLDYEQAATEHPPLREGYYDLSTHLPWIGERTRDIGGAHVEFFRGIRNPIGVKVGPTMEPEELLALLQVLNPDDEPGRITLIARMGAKKVAERLPPLVEAVRRAERVVTWCSDPMHGNTYKTADGTKTRRFDDILAEVDQSFLVHADVGSVLGGVHFELTGENVTEIVGGSCGLTEADLGSAYESDVDPRLNHAQALEMAFLIARRLKDPRFQPRSAAVG
ncbi:MAG: 3-deoxy-7-phosphoheptulonate synthase class II [Pseudomonadota bacterium]|nr:3-deoxy-7-phosphoheptulonate synthase class II [Pseudomonadota bacterium]